MVLLFLHQHESLHLVDVPGGIEHAVGPGHEGLVPAAPGETDALLDETGAQTQPAIFGFDQKESELGDLIAGLDNEDATDPLALGDFLVQVP